MSTMEKKEEVISKEDEIELNYKPPPEKSLHEIVEADQDDPSLRKYKEMLLGSATKQPIVVDPSTEARVIVRNLALIVDGRDDLVLDLSGNLDELKRRVYRIKEGIQYKIRIDFYVQREIVTGLKYVQKIKRKGITVEKLSQMVGSYAPKLELQSFTSPKEEMPSGMLYRDTYSVSSLFTDDDNNEHLKWEWTFELKKDWE